jgi:predicted Zn-dependent protease
MTLLTPDEIFTDIVETPITLEILVLPPFIETEEHHVAIMQQLQEEAIYAPSNQLVAKIKKLMRKYPSVPVLSNLLIQLYVTLGNSKLAQKALNDSILRHPNYLSAKLNKANSFFTQGKADLMLKTFEGKFTLRAHSPKQEVFHYTEVANFYQTTGLYYALIGDAERASSAINALESIEGLPASTLKVLRSAIQAIT